MVRALWQKRNLVIDEAWVGGGGNVTGECRAMSLGWLRGVVEDLVTRVDPQTFDLGREAPGLLEGG